MLERKDSRMKTKGLVQSLVLASLLAAGFLAVWGVLGFWALEVGTSVAMGMDSRLALIVPMRSVLLFLPDGTPVIGTQQFGMQRQFRDLQGNPVAEPEGEHPFLTLVPLPAKFNPDKEIDWEDRIRSFADGRVPTGYWYFIADGRSEGSGYFVGYDSESRTCLGYLGLNGLRENPLPDAEQIPFAGVASTRGARERLLCAQRGYSATAHPLHHKAGRAPHGSVSTWDVYVLGREGKLYHVDLQKRTLQVAFDSSPVLSAALTAGQPDAIRGTPYRPTVRTEDAVLVLDERGTELKRYPIPESLRGREINFSETSTDEAVLYASSPEDFLATEVTYHICRVDSAGRCRQATTVLPFLSTRRVLPLAGVVMPSPLVLAGMVAYLRPPMLQDADLAESYPEALGQALAEFWSALVLAQLWALGLAVLCYRRQVRYGANRTERLVWPLFVLLLGLPGWIGYRFGRSWPVLEACPECGVTVPRHQESCVRCVGRFPRPELKGIEVFA
jgi:hypothetical protein